MLRIYPESALDYAVEGVVQAASLGHATEVTRLRAVARAQARDERERARDEASALSGRALAEGYRDGLVQAITSLLPLLEALQQEQRVLGDAMRSQMRERLQAMAADPAVAVPQWTAACEHWAAQADVALVLHLPDTQPALLAALRAVPALAQVDIRPAARQQPLLEVGPMAYSLDVQQLLLESVDDALQRHLPRLQPLLTNGAADYCRALQMELAGTLQRSRFAALKATT